MGEYSQETYGRMQGTIDNLVNDKKYCEQLTDELQEKVERYEKIIKFAMKHTEDDDIHEFLNRALQGKENEAPSYRLKMR